MNALEMIQDILNNTTNKPLHLTPIIICSSPTKNWRVLSVYSDDFGNICFDIEKE